MKILICLLILSTFEKSYGSHMVCVGKRVATSECGPQEVRLDISTRDEFEMQSIVQPGYQSTNPNDICYQISSGKIVRKYNGEYILAADRMSHFFPNYGGLPLNSNIFVGSFYYNGKTFGLRDRMTKQDIQLFCR